MESLCSASYVCCKRNKDGRLAYHSMHEHLKYCHSVVINMNESDSLSDSAKVKQHKIESCTWNLMYSNA